jgi:hypothetical protein
MRSRCSALIRRFALVVATLGCSEGDGAESSLGTPEVCRFELSGALSSVIPTVGVVDWSTDLEPLHAARLEFTLNDPKPGEINTGSGGPVDITGTRQRALMLGLKPERTYTYRIVAESGTTVCASPARSLTTGSAAGAPVVSRTVHDAAARARGFIVTSGGYAFTGGGVRLAYIVDADGDVVWWAPAPQQCSRALLDWEGATLWMVDTNPTVASRGKVRSVGMDGHSAVNEVAGLPTAHHDLTVLPGGVVAALVWSDDGSSSSDLVERFPDGTARIVARLDSSVFPASAGEFHANALLYHAADDSYTVSDLFARAYAKLTRAGELLWQFGGDCEGAPAPKCAGAAWDGNHGHHLLDDGSLLFFSASHSDASRTYEYRLTESDAALEASLVWSYAAADTRSVILGDVQRLPNGNTLVVFSTAAEIHEVSPAGQLVQVIGAVVPPDAVASPSFGYANFRESLYGPPLR